MRVRRWIRLVGAGASAVSLVVVGAVVAQAATSSAAAAGSPPPNDTFAGAVPIASIPFATTLDTSGATTDADDVEANANCTAAATGASVWYSLTPNADGGLVVDVSGSSYAAGVIVVIGAPGSFQFVQCGPGAVTFDAVAGTTYHLMTFDTGLTPKGAPPVSVGSGGTLVMKVDVIPPPPVVTVSVDPSAEFDPFDGSATIHGTMTCVGPVTVAFNEAFVTQKVGRGMVVGTGSDEVRCSSESQPWSMRIAPKFGTKFAGGKAATVTFSEVCGPFQCTDITTQYSVQLSRRS